MKMTFVMRRLVLTATALGSIGAGGYGLYLYAHERGYRAAWKAKPQTILHGLHFNLAGAEGPAIRVDPDGDIRLPKGIMITGNRVID